MKKNESQKITYCMVPPYKILEMTKFCKWKTDYWFLGIGGWRQVDVVILEQYGGSIG